MDKKGNKRPPWASAPPVTSWLDAAVVPIAPRVECSVFGCRNTNRDPVGLYPLPQDPDRRNQWLKRINRLDLASKPQSGAVCSAHFKPQQLVAGAPAPTALPSTMLPSRSTAVVSAPLNAESVVQEDLTMDIKLESDQPTSTFLEEPQPSDLNTQDNPSFQVYQHTPLMNNQPSGSLPQHNISPISLMTPCMNPILVTPTQLPFIMIAQTPAQMNTQIPHQIIQQQLVISPMCLPEPEPRYLENQMHASTQTGSREAFHRYATFSAVEQINIPPRNSALAVKKRSVASQTTPELVEVFIVDIKQKLGEELNEARRHLKIAKDPRMEKTHFLRACDRYLDEKIANFVKSHAYLSNKFAGNKYPEEFKIFALKLYLWNPKSYKYVEQFFDLPSKDVIQKFRMPVKSGINPSLMEALKVKVGQMSILGRQCVVCFDVTTLKKNLYYDTEHDYLCGMEEIDGVIGDEPAEYGAIIAVRGLFTRWKQPVSFALLPEKRRPLETRAWLHKTIGALIDIGLDVKALITNIDDVYHKEPYFIIRGGKIFNIIDYPDLLRIAREELIQYNVYVAGSLVNWDHVLSVYEFDKTQELKILSLTEKHVSPDANVKSARQLFSSNMAAALHFHVAAGFLNEEAEDTVHYFTTMKELHEILYSRKLSKAYRPSDALDASLNEVSEYFKKLQLKANGNVIDSKFVSGLAFTLNSIKEFAADLKKSNSYLLTKNLSKDFMQDYFKMKRKYELPTAIEFTRQFRKLYLSNILNNAKKTATGDDMMGTLAKISEYVKTDINKTEEEDTVNLNTGIIDYKTKWPSNEYITGYILWKCLEKHTCEECVKNLCDYYNIEANSDILINMFKFFNAKNVRAVTKINPPRQLVDAVNKMEYRFQNYIRNVKNNMNFGRNLYDIIEKDSFEMPCLCFPYDAFRLLYIRLKIFSTVKELNKTNKKSNVIIVID